MDEDSSIWSRWYVWPLIFVPGGVSVGVLILLAISFPLLPTTKTGWLACVGAGMAVSLWLGLGTFFHSQFECQIRPRRLYMAIAALLIVATGGGMIWAYIANQNFIAANFGYWHF